tara:strand:+ start:370 stop:1077 length:708 start_codon:yes stop_codon:yes gene_type:complete
MYITYKNGKEHELIYDDIAHTYKVNDVKIPSVTRIIDACFEKNLTNWAISIGDVEYHRIISEALEIGNETHKYIEEYILYEMEDGRHLPKIDKAEKSLTAFAKWDAKFEPEYLDAERKVYCDKYQYAGTVDAVAKINGRVCVIDFKTSKKIYKPYHLQVTAYAQAIKRIDGLRQWPLGIILRLDKLTGEYEQKVFEPKDHMSTFIKCLELRQWSSLRIKNDKNKLESKNESVSNR